MSIQKQERLLSYEPTVIIATPGRLWELLNERNNQYLVECLPMIDILVLDEADRMIEDGHFKEMRLLLEFIYTKRVEYKKAAIDKGRANKTEENDDKRKYKQDVLEKMSKKDKVHVKDIEKKQIDLSNVVDLYDEDGMLEEIDADNLVIEHDE